MEISTIVTGQRSYFERGETISTAFRIRMLKKLQDAIEGQKKEILAALKTDLGKSETEASMTELNLVLAELRLMIKKVPKWNRRTKAKTVIALFPAKCYRVPEPYGTVLIMSPWNYPFLLTLQPLIGALAAGNTAVVKPSAYAPATSKLIAGLLGGIFDPEYVAVVEGGRAENQQLLDQKFDYIFFTGSVRVGKTVMEKAAAHLTPVTLELGGKSPVIIDETADLALAARRIVFGKFINAGQTCVAPDYVYVREGRENALIEALKAEIEAQYPKDGSGDVIDYPHIINEKHFLRLRQLMYGEEIAVGGRFDEDDRTIEPTVLLHVRPDAPVMQEEIFGPILPILTYKNFSEVEAFIKARPKPLALYLFTTDKTRMEYVETHIPFGGGCVNDTIMHLSSHTLPFGGVGESGMGAYHGIETFRTFTHVKSVVEKGTKADFKFRYRPYTVAKRNLLKRLQ